jgi:hypothetical protein
MAAESKRPQPIARALMTVLALSAALAIGVVGQLERASSANAGSCAVTVPNRIVRAGAGMSAAAFNYGNAFLRANIWPHGTLPAGTLPDGSVWANINPDGSISAKLGWWRGSPGGKLVIGGHRLDGLAYPLHAHVPAGYGSRGFQPSGVRFSTTGCWQVVGKVGRAKLSFVVKVIKVRKRPA